PRRQLAQRPAAPKTRDRPYHNGQRPMVRQARRGLSSPYRTAVFTTCSTASGFRGTSTGCRRHCKSSVTVTPRPSAKGISRAVSGTLTPVSHLLTALSEINSCWASAFCVRPFSLRSWATKDPNRALSSSYIEITSSVSYHGPRAFGNRTAVELGENREK